MGMWIRLLLILSALGPVFAASQCPKLPEHCVCEPQSNAKLSIHCNSVDPSTVLKSIAGLNIDKLEFTDCSWPYLSSIPSCNIRSLAVISCNVSSVSEKAFQHVRNSIEELNLYNNSIVTVPLFGKLPKLVSLNLNNNKLKTIPESVFDGLVNIKHLRIENNEICELYANALNETKPSIELLDLSGNCFSAIPAKNLRNSGRLMYLDLSDNKISEVANFQLMNLPMLKELRLNDNFLSRVDAMAFMNVPQLQQLNMRNNLIANLDGNRLQAFKELEMLDVSNNLLTKVPAIKELTTLKQVLLDGNQITKIETLAFSNNPKLQLISLQDNNIGLISRNSFESLDQLIILLLANNSIRTIERGMLDGMKNLQQLNLRNNSLVEVESNAFISVKQLTSLDLAHNRLQRIGKGAFSQLHKLFWLDLSNNRLTTFEKGTFDGKIANILLDGNQLQCDDSMDWFASYLVQNRVRTFLPFQTEIVCTGPKKYEGTRLKEIMMKKANDTLNNSLQLVDSSMQRSLISSFIPGLNALSSGGSMAGAKSLNAVPVLSTITQALPSLRNLPGMNVPLSNGGPASVGIPQNRDIGSALEQFTGPLVRFATGGQPVASDIEQLIQSIPNLVVNVPGMGNVDIAKLDPALISYVLRGGQVPGIPKESLDAIIKQYMTKMAEAAEAAQKGHRLPQHDKLLPPMDKLPGELVTNVINGKNLPGLNAAQTNVIKEYYTRPVPVAAPVAAPMEASTNGSIPPVFESSRANGLLGLLPPGYDITKISAEVVQAVARGEIPDMKLLPQDLQDHFKANPDKLISTFATKNLSIESILEKIPNFPRTDLITFDPYDINSISHDAIKNEENQKNASKMRLYTAVALGFVGAATIIVVAVLYYIMVYKPAKMTSTLMSPQRSIGMMSPQRSNVLHSPREGSTRIDSHIH